MNEKFVAFMILEKAKSISERIYGLVEEYDEDFEVWEEILLCLVGDHTVNVPAEEWVGNHPSSKRI